MYLPYQKLIPQKLVPMILDTYTGTHIYLPKIRVQLICGKNMHINDFACQDRWD